MAKSLSIAQLKQLAAHGARARIAELQAELAAITRAFPEAASSVGSVAGRRRRRTMSAAGRAAISAAQKKRWAAVRKKKAAAES